MMAFTSVRVIVVGAFISIIALLLAEDETSGAPVANEPLSPSLAAWKGRGSFLDVFGMKVFSVVVEAKAKSQGDIIILHGFPSSSYDFHSSIDLLAQHHRVIVHDMPGYGFSDKPTNYSYSMMEQADVAIEVWRHFGVDKHAAHLLSHDMGDSVATEIHARRLRHVLPDWLATSLKSHTLTNGGVIFEYANLRLGQLLLRNSFLAPLTRRLFSYWFFHRQIASIVVSLPEAEYEDMWSALLYNNGKAVLTKTIGYLHERARFGTTRWLNSLLHSGLPVHVVWGRQDSVAPAAMADRLRELAPRHTFRFTWMEQVGHYLMLEDAEGFAKAVLSYEPLQARA